MWRIVCAVGISLVAVPVVSAGAVVEDVIGARVARAEADYDRQVKRERDALLAKLDREVQDARHAKQADRLRRAQRERTAFIERDVVPKSVGATTYLREVQRARRALAAAYARAAEEYRSAGREGDAAATDQRRERLQEEIDAETRPEQSIYDVFPEGSVWGGALRVKAGRGAQFERRAQLTVSRRERDRFEARVTMTDPRVIMVVNGRVNGKVVTWSTSDAKIEAGGIGRQSYTGRISDQRLEIELSGTTREGKPITGSGTLFRDVHE